MQKSTKNLLSGVMLGAIAGAIAGVLFAPKSGKETRTEIANYTSEMKDKIASELAKMGDITKESYGSVVDRVLGMYEAAKKISRRDAAEIRAKLDENYEQVEDVVKKARRKKSDDEV